MMSRKIAAVYLALADGLRIQTPTEVGVRVTEPRMLRHYWLVEYYRLQRISGRNCYKGYIRLSDIMPVTGVE
jgi:hypothetical protein